jgi:hypothetical protein
MALSVRDGKVSFQDFSRIPLINGLYRHGYFQGFDVQHFDLLIIQERMGTGVAALSRLLGQPAKLIRSNDTKLYRAC